MLPAPSSPLITTPPSHLTAYMTPSNSMVCGTAWFPILRPLPPPQASTLNTVLLSAIGWNCPNKTTAATSCLATSGQVGPSLMANNSAVDSCAGSSYNSTVLTGVVCCPDEMVSARVLAKCETPHPGPLVASSLARGWHPVR